MPKIGLRLIKTAFAVLLCLLIDIIRPNGIPFYSIIAAILCIQNTLDDTKVKAKSRVIATLIGGVYGMMFLSFERYIYSFDVNIIRTILISLAIIPIIYTTILLKKQSSAYISCVTFMSIAITHMKDVNPFIFGTNRIIDTLIGVFISILLNSVHIPFLVRPLDCQLNTFDQLNSRYVYLLNHLIKHNVNITLHSLSIPMEYIQKININHPVYLFNGTIIYSNKQIQPYSTIDTIHLKHITNLFSTQNIPFCALEVNNNHILQHCFNMDYFEYPPISFNYTATNTHCLNNISCIITPYNQSLVQLINRLPLEYVIDKDYLLIYQSAKLQSDIQFNHIDELLKQTLKQYKKLPI